MRRRWLRVLALVCTLGLVAVACGSDDDSAGDTSSDNGADSADPTDEPTEEATADATEAPTDEATEEPTEEIVLTDSFRGVTSDTITLGLTVIDFEELNARFNLDLAFQDFTPAYEAMVADLNDRGGILGRQVVLESRQFVPADPVAAETACTELTEDIEAFAVLNGFSGPLTEPVNSCIYDLHETVLIGPIPQTPDPSGLWITGEMALDRRNGAAITAMDEASLFDDLGPILVVGAGPEEQPLVDGFVADLAEVGVESTGVVAATAGDEIATIAEVEIFVEAAETAGISTVALLGEGEHRNQAFFRIRPEWTYIMANGDRITDWQAIPPKDLQPETRVISNNNGPEVPITDEDYLRCIDIIEAATGIEIKPTSELEDGEPNYWSGAVGACRNLLLFEQIATAAGPELTNDSWVAALDMVPDLVVPGFVYSSFSRDKVDARDSLVLVEYDLESLTFVPISEPIDVG
jgi:hypothetical protein